jgi:hypothetical protein
VHPSSRRTWNVLGPGFSPVTSVCPFSSIRPMIHSHLRLHTALTRTSGRRLETSKAVLFVIQSSTGHKMCFILLDLQGFISFRTGKCDSWLAVGQSSLDVIKSACPINCLVCNANDKTEALLSAAVSATCYTGLRRADPLSQLQNLTDNKIKYRT